MRDKKRGMQILQPDLFDIWDEQRLIAACTGLGCSQISEASEEEQKLLQGVDRLADCEIAELRASIERGEDPLGEIFCNLRPPQVRRRLGATYTPLPIVQQMVRGMAEVGIPERVVDPGCGSARFLVAAGRKFPEAQLVGFEIDPLAAILARAHLMAAGMGSRAEIRLQDYRQGPLPEAEGKTLFIGNPPYVRHHLLGQTWKEWLTAKAHGLGLKASQLAGLHVYFFMATVLNAKKGDFGSFITASEWLDVNYGRVLRELFLDGLGGTSITVIEPTACPFPDAATTAAVTNFSIGCRPLAISLARVESAPGLAHPDPIRLVARERLQLENRWSHLTRGARDIPQDFVELGELCRVHRGAVTGANHIWIAGAHSIALPDEILFPTVTRGRELKEAGFELLDSSVLRKVIDLPEDLDLLDGPERKAVDRFLRFAKSNGAADGYIARTRKAWWSVGLRTPAPILASYMARRAPSFVLNRAEVRHINIAHGLYPRQAFASETLDQLVRFLSTSISVTDGRTYAGGLTKFEPREMERLLVPSPLALGSYLKC